MRGQEILPPPPVDRDQELAELHQEMSFLTESIDLDEERARCEGSFIEFFKGAWSEIDPAPLRLNWHHYCIAEHLEAVRAGEIRKLLVNIPPRFGKALDCDTPVLTTWGWKRHGDLAPDDFVFGPDGKPKRVLGVTEQSIQETFELKFDDGAKIVASGDHLWEVDRHYAYGGGPPKYGRIRKREIYQTKDLIVTGGSERQRPDYIPLCEPVEFPPRRFLIDPYMLGCWLGDGCTTSAQLYVSDEDLPHFSKLGRVSFTIQPSERNVQKQPLHHLRPEGLEVKLRISGLLGNKHIPQDYLDASIEQRWELLRGLMDTDGCAENSGACTYTTKLPGLAFQVCLLQCSLGLKPTIREKFQIHDGVRHGPYYIVTFVPPSEVTVFNLKRKQDNLKPAISPRSRGRYLQSITPAGSRLVNCILVEGGLYLAGYRLVKTHNTSLITVAYPAWLWIQQEIDFLSGPQASFLCASYGEKPVFRQASAARRLLMGDWFVKRWASRVRIIKDGLDELQNSAGGFRISSSLGGAILGAGANLRILDDPHSTEMAESETERDRTVRLFSEGLTTRRTDPMRSAMIVVMQRLHEGDVSGWILENELSDWTHVCCDADTEILTRSGWIKFPDLPKDADVMGVNPETLVGNWERPTHYVDLPFSGEMIHFKSQTFDLMVTPAHRCIYCDPNDHADGNYRWRVRFAKLLPRDFYAPQVIKWEALQCPITYGGIEWDRSVFAEFMGWYLAEGCVSTHFHGKYRYRQLRIVQKTGSTGAGDINTLAAKLPFRFNECSNGGGMSVWASQNKRLVIELDKLGKQPVRFVPEEVKNLDTESIKIFLMAFCKGDGHFAARNPLKMTIGSSSERLIDDIQECAVKAGWASSKNIKEDPGAGYFPNGSPRGPSTVYKLYIRAGKAPGKQRKWYSQLRGHHRADVPYVGRVYCVTVPSGGIVVRRNGRIAITGNCLPQRFDPRRFIESFYFSDPRTEDGELLWPELHPKELVDADERTMGPTAFAGQMQQSPTPRGGNIIQRDWWKVWPDDAPEFAEQSSVCECPKCGWIGPVEGSDPIVACHRCYSTAERKVVFPEFSYRILSIDTNYGEKQENAYSAATVLGVWHAKDDMPRVMLCGGWRGRPPLRTDPAKPRELGLVERFHSMAARHQVDCILIEQRTRGWDLYNELAKQTQEWQYQLQYFNPVGRGDKVARLHACQALFTNDCIWAPNKDWADMVIAEVVSAPRGRFWDLSDCVVQGLLYLRHDMQLLKLPDEHKREQLRERLVEARHNRSNVRELIEG